MISVGKNKLLVCKKITDYQGVREKKMLMWQEGVLMGQGSRWVNWPVFKFLFCGIPRAFCDYNC